MWNNQKQQNVVFFYVKLTNLLYLLCQTYKLTNLQTYYLLDFQKVDQHTGGKWLIHGTKRRKDNQLQSLELHCRIS